MPGFGVAMDSLDAWAPQGNDRPLDDWTLLDFRDTPEWVKALPSIARCASICEGDEYHLVGYPSGAARWNVETSIAPITARGHRWTRTDDSAGWIATTGGDSAPGMSGGGVFAADGSLVALHRAAFDAALERYAIPIREIFARLEEGGLFLATERVPDRWPEMTEILEQTPWLVSNLTTPRARFLEFLKPGAPYRMLRLEGASATGKTRLTEQMHNALRRLSGVRSGRFSFKGSGDLRSETQIFCGDLGVPTPADHQPELALASILSSLRKDQSPTVLIFDTYEKAEACADWFERSLLQALPEMPWLRLVIAGQRVPRTSTAKWRELAYEVCACQPASTQDWIEYGRLHKPQLSAETIENICSVSPPPFLLAQLLDPSAS